MQYNIYINQIKACEWGLNLQQAALFSFLYEIPSWAECHVISGITWHRIARSKLVFELPILTSKIDTIYRQMRVLVDTGLIEINQQGTVTLVRITTKGKGWNRDLGKKSEGSGETPGATSEKIPTYHSTILDPPTTPPTPQQQSDPSLSAGGGEVDIDDDTKDYIRLVLRKDSKKATHPGRYVRGALKRIKSQGGLSSADREDLEAARSAEKQTQQYAALKKPSPREAVASPIWEMAKQKLANIFLEADYQLWIQPLCCVMDDEAGSKLVLAGTDPYFSSWVKNNYMDHITAALPGRSVQVI